MDRPTAQHADSHLLSTAMLVTDFYFSKSLLQAWLKQKFVISFFYTNFASKYEQ